MVLRGIKLRHMVYAVLTTQVGLLTAIWLVSMEMLRQIDNLWRRVRFSVRVLRV
jgi:hypothetical protein